MESYGSLGHTWGIRVMEKSLYKDGDRDPRKCLKCGCMSVSYDYTMHEHRRMCMGCGRMWNVIHDRDNKEKRRREMS